MESMESKEMCEWFEDIIENLIEEYKDDESIINLDWMHGAIEALEKLKEKLQEE